MAKFQAIINADILTILQPLLLVTRMGGFCPVTYAPNTGSSLYKLSRSVGWWAYSYVLALLIFSTAFAGLVLDSIKLGEGMSKYIVYADVGEIILSVFITIVSAPFWTHFLFEAIECFQKIDKIMPKNKAKMQRKKVIIFMTLALLLVVFVLSYDLVMWSNKAVRHHVLQDFVLKNAPYYLALILVIIQQMHYWALALMIKVRIEELNLYLKRCVDDASRKNDKLWTVRHDERNGLRNVAGVDSTQALTKNRVALLMQLYDLIWEATMATNNYCSVSVLSVLLSCLLHLVINPYFFLLELLNEGYPPFILLQFAWIFLHACRLMIIIEGCHTCSDQYENTLTLIYKLLTFNMEEDVKDQLNSFASQLSSKRIKFSSFALVEIDRSLLTGFSNIVTTFLVILLQFGNLKGANYWINDDK